MTQPERAQVWAEKLRLTQELAFVSNDDAKRSEHIKELIEQCNTQLIKNELSLESSQQSAPSTE